MNAVEKESFSTTQEKCTEEDGLTTCSVSGRGERMRGRGKVDGVRG